MKATVFYITLSERQRNEINRAGWDCPSGRLYHRAKDGDVDSIVVDMVFERAATVEIDQAHPGSDAAEAIWTKLQNVHQGWADQAAELGVEVHTDFPRSMDVGDVILWPNGDAQRVAPVSFQSLGEYGSALFRGRLLIEPMDG